MIMFKRFGKNKAGSASRAADRLRVVIDSQRLSRRAGGDQFERELQKAILQVIKKNFSVQDEEVDVQIKAEGDENSELELTIDIHGLKPN